MSTSTGVGLTWSSSQVHLPYWSSSDVLTIEDLFILSISCYLCNTSIECRPPCESWINIFNLCLITTPHSWAWISLDQPNWVHTQFLLTTAKLTIHPPSSFACVYHGPILRSLGMLEPFLDCGNINVNLSILPSLVLLIPMTRSSIVVQHLQRRKQRSLKGRYYLIQKTSKQSWNENK
jgi:hypothetical protein